MMMDIGKGHCRRLYIIAAIVCIIGFFQQTKAQLIFDSTSNAKSFIVEQKKFDKKKWERITKDIDFNETKEKKDSTRNYNFSFSFLNGSVAQIIFFTLIIAVLGFILFKLFGGNLTISNKKLKNAPNYNVLDLEENIQETNLEAFLQDALNNNSYRLAIRVYYLMIIKELSIKEWIIWKKDKTNSEYIYEIRQKPCHQQFREVTIAFERVWYGNTDINEVDYHYLSPVFSNLIETIKKKETE